MRDRRRARACHEWLHSNIGVTRMPLKDRWRDGRFRQKAAMGEKMMIRRLQGTRPRRAGDADARATGFEAPKGLNFATSRFLLLPAYARFRGFRVRFSARRAAANTESKTGRSARRRQSKSATYIRCHWRHLAGKKARFHDRGAAI